MSYPGDIEENNLTGDQTDDQTTVGGLSMITPTPQTLEKAMALQNIFAANKKAQAEEYKKSVLGPQTKAWDDYAAYLKGMRTGPSSAQTLLDIGSALLKPTNYQGLGATFGNVAPVLAQREEALRAAEQQRQDLLAKYNLQRAQSEAAGAKGLLDLSKGNQALALRYLIASGKKQPLPRVIIDPLGVVHHPNLGSELKTAPPGAVKDLLADPSPENMKHFDDIFGLGHAKIILDYNALQGEGGQ